MRVKVSDGFTQRLTNPAQVEEMKDRTGIATFDPNTKPVENGLIPDAPKEKTGEVAESLLEGFDERVVTFKAAVMSPSTNHVYVSIVDGPAQGYVWDIRRLVASFPLLLQEGNFTTGTKA
ncbi:MAG TPA: hypothetical protein VHI52_04075, partial [Verrucomicrobiae bacterium]|nr:hypothetical protein [Verrucomicrobiae bacterium]